jgi:hypothetical protein
MSMISIMRLGCAPARRRPARTDAPAPCQCSPFARHQQPPREHVRRSNVGLRGTTHLSDSARTRLLVRRMSEHGERIITGTRAALICARPT